MRVDVCLLVLALGGCSASGALQGLQTAGQVTPTVLGEIEQLKTAVATAPVAGCVSLLQQVQMQMNSLAKGTPGIPVSPNPPPPPILSTPPILPPSSSSDGVKRVMVRFKPTRVQVARDTSFDWLWSRTTFIFDKNLNPVPVTKVHM